jgi:hypothetical protein
VFGDINGKIEDLARKVKYLYQVTSSTSGTHMEEKTLNKNFLIKKRKHFDQLA